MKLTKYEHACVVLEEQGKKLVIDPGEFTKNFGEPDNVVAVVVTHVHGDHLGAENIQAIITANPGVKIFTTPEAVKHLADPHAKAVKAGDELTVGPFKLCFYGKLHKAVHAFSPQNQNVGVLVNDMFYTPGDSFTQPDKPVKVLAVPTSAPWLQLGESIDFVKDLKPERFFRTHDGLYNERGVATANKWFTMANEQFGPKYLPLNPGDVIEL